ncbi:PAS domain S-box protein [Desulforhopalus vacuolatus]|uniref:PAS domain S-box protein n=1 Tax=Desulforhopalus vacuolatus TaxID=40414 RepID=UPI001965AE86|nr:PAS domain S-box protein [Desulforhopalus vacuolatus]MBM9520485.1 PAS domain S-box protein [Desulforhopalus vacuolatus]
MKKIILFGPIIWICLISFCLPAMALSAEIQFTKEEQAWLEAHPVIRVQNEKNGAPLNFFDHGKAQGLSIDYMDLLAKKIGIQVEYITGPGWDEFLGMARQKQIDVILNIVETDKRKNSLFFTDQYLLRANLLTGLEVTSETILGDLNRFNLRMGVRHDWPILHSILHKAMVTVSPVDMRILQKKWIGLEKESETVLIKRGVQTSSMLNLTPAEKDWPEFRSIVEKAIEAIPPDQVKHLRQQWTLDEVQKIAAPNADPASYMQILIYGVIVLFLLLLLSLIVLKLIKTERISKVFGSRQFRLYVLLSLTVFVIAVAVIGWLALGSIRYKMMQNIENNLRGSLKITNYALGYWVRDRKSMIKHLSQTRELSEITQRLLAVPHNPRALLSSSALQDARAFFEKDSGVFNNIGFFIIGPDYISLGSKRDCNVGTTNLIAEQRPDLIKRAFKGEVLFVPPIRSDVLFEESNSNETRTMPPTMFFIGPIEDSRENIIAVFTLRVDPSKGFTESLQVVGDSSSQETYAFNKDGVLLTNSRFENQLRLVGLIEEGQPSAMNVILKNPGVNLMKGEIPTISIAEQPLTLMAEQALSDQKKSRGSKLNAPELIARVNIDGYRDYRGVPVFGAWLWDSNLEVGIATEIDMDEAMSNCKYVRNILITVLGLTLLLSISATLLVLVLGQRASKLLARGKEDLEDMVAKRTAELAAAEAHSRLILSSMGEGLIEVDTQGKTTFANVAALALLGYSVGEMQGNDLHNMIHHSYADGSRYESSACPMDKSFSTGVPRIINNEVLWRKDGTSIPVEYSVTPMLRDGVIVGSVIVFQDVTERRKAEQGLQNSREQLQHILDTSPIAVAFSMDGIIHFSNPAFEALYGVKVGDESPTIYVNTADRDEMIGMLQRDGKVSNHEVQMFNKNKDIRDMLISYLPLTYEGKNGILGWLLDITERKQSELEIAKNEAKFRMLFEAVSIPLCYFKSDGTVVEINSKFTELFGYTLEDIPTANQWYKRAYPDPVYRKWVMEKWGVAVQNAQDTGTDIRSLEYEVTSKSGEVLTLIIAGSLHEGSMIFTFIDITERKKMEAAMAGERDRLQEMMNTSPVGIVISVDGVFRFANNQFESQTGLKEGDVAAKAYVDPESRKPITEDIARYGKLENHSTQLYGADGSIHDMLITYYSFDYEGEKGVLSWCVDVTEMKEIETELRIKFDELERFRKLAAGREIKMIDLKKEINTLLEVRGEKGKYKIH